MDGFFTPISTTYLKAKESEPFLAEVKPVNSVQKIAGVANISSADDALDLLKNQPDYDGLLAILHYLTTTSQRSAAFHLDVPGPKSASIVQLLVTEIAPNYWALLLEGSRDDFGGLGSLYSHDARLLTQCLRSVTGINALVSHIRALTQEWNSGTKDSRRPDISLNLGIFLDLLAAVLEGDESVRSIWVASTYRVSNDALKKAQSQTLVSLITGGRIASVTAEASVVAGRDEVVQRARWLADGVEFSKWLGQNVVSWAKLEPTGAELNFCSDLFHRGLSLGYSESLLKTVIEQLLLSEGVDSRIFAKVLLHQPQGAKKIITNLLDHLARQVLNRIDDDDKAFVPSISAAAAVIDSVISNDEVRKSHLISWCATSSGAGLGDGVGIRRAVLAVLARDKELITSVLEKSLSQFGDELYIKHAAILQQEVHAQVVLLSAGYVFKRSPIKLTMLLRSGTYMRTISNRIASTQTKARFLGMVVGEALSTLAEVRGKQLDFHMEEMDTEEAQWLKSLTRISDKIGPLMPIQSKNLAMLSSPGMIGTKQQAKPISKPKAKPKPRPAVSTLPPKGIIEEIDSSDEDDDDLVPYAKASDPEDSDDDPTLVQRNKLKPPVYIRDLILFLRDSEVYDKQKLALQTAPVLIRRKANYGAEVSAHADELAGLLVGVQDKFELDNFDDLRLQSMIALVVAQPKSMAPWFARTFFEGDYSLNQRMSVLLTLGLSARELAGFETSGHKSAATFASKRLPQKMEQLYLNSADGANASSPSQLKALPATALDTITQSLTSTFLAPLAAEAADATTGPDVLKLETFTARYKSRSKTKPRVRAIPNTTAALLATAFFSPLTAHFQVAIRSAMPVVLNPVLLALYLQTLGVIIHSAGPSTLSLPQLTSELWDLLLGVRVHVLSDLGALRGWLVAMAALLEVNGGEMRRVCEEQGREVVETRAWVGGVFERTRGGDDGEENEVKMLSAGVLITLGEAIEKHQALLMGDLIGFS